MSRMNFDKIIQWKNEIDVCTMLLRSRPDDETLKMRLFLATEEYDRQRNPGGNKKRNTTTGTKREPKVKTLKVKQPKQVSETIRYNALKRYKDGIMVEHYRLTRSYVRNTNKHHKVFVDMLPKNVDNYIFADRTVTVS